MPRGGRRSGRPGEAYPNRADLAQAVRTAPGQQYGQAKQQADAQRAVPLPQSAPPAVAQPPPSTLAPPEPGLLHAPSARPAEPVTAGLPIGAGPGPEALFGAGRPDGDLLPSLYAAFRTAPSEGLRSAIETLERLNASR